MPGPFPNMLQRKKILLHRKSDSSLLSGFFLLLLLPLILSVAWNAPGDKSIPGKSSDYAGFLPIPFPGACDVVVDSGSIQSALDSARPRSTVCVKNGVYRGKVNISKTGIVLKNYPGHKPVIIPGYGLGNRVEINAPETKVEGLEISGGYEGVKIYQPNTTIRNNYIHDNKFAGIVIVSTDNNLIVDNDIELNGTCGRECDVPGEERLSPKNVHGIYISDYLCKGARNNIIRNNVIKDNPGMGINFNGSFCDRGITGTIVEGNELINNSWGIALFYNVRDSRFRNNRLSVSSHPKTNHAAFTHLGLWGSKNNLFRNNIFISIIPGYQPIMVFDKESEDQDIDRNIWSTKEEEWMWSGKELGSFKSSYKKTTGWDENGTIR